ncbi:MAG: PhnA domain-containing protein [Bacteroidota bacterium]|nr:PhnA domain-containing protein [Bacteroidota bacterium]
MSISQALKDRNSNLCELCNAENATHEYTVSPKNDESIANQVAVCDTCLKAIDDKEAGFHWRCLEGSIWNPEPSVQALSYRLLHQYKEEAWAENIISSVDLDEDTIQWALSAYEVSAVHKDAFGNVLENGDNVVLTQGLNVKGTSFTAQKGTVVKRIKLVHDNTDHIEGKVNEQVIVILTKYTKKLL